MEWSNHRGPYTKYDGLPADYYAIFFNCGEEFTKKN